ncbi:MAG: hypothetical protein HC913_14415 [Microscillaceae bacterium]|nr:hypothetical protein [Microscillaceae bacterium]
MEVSESEMAFEPALSFVFEASRMSQAEEQMGLEAFTDPFGKHQLAHLQDFYTGMPDLAHQKGIETPYLQAMQHNLIVAMVLYHDLLEKESSETIVFYAQEFDRLGAGHGQVAGAFEAYLQSKRLALSLPVLAKAARQYGSTAAEFASLRAELTRLRKEN